MRTQLKLIFAVLFFAGFAMSQWYGTRSNSVVREPAAIEKTSAFQDSSTPKVMAREKDTQVFHFKREIHASMDGKKTLMDLHLDGKVWVSTLARTGAMKTLSIQFEMKALGKSETYSSSFPFVVDLNSDYTIHKIKIRKPAAKSEEDELNLLKDFLSLYAFRSDEDTTGRYEYNWNEKKQKGEKTKTKYQGKDLKAVSIISSHHSVQWAVQTRDLIKAEGTDEVAFSGGVGASIKTKSSYLIEQMNEASVPKVALVESNYLSDETSVQIRSQFARAQVIDYKILSAHLDQIETMNKSERLSFFHELSKTLRANPDQTEDFVAKILSFSKKPGMLTFGIGVLATVGTAPAQATLVSLYQDFVNHQKNSEVGHTILNSLGTADAALTPETRHFLLDVANPDHSSPDLVENAAFALGSSLKKSNDEDVRTRLSRLYESASSDQSRANILDAIGNSGDSKLLSTVQFALNSSQSMERGKAAFALRFMDPAVASPLLIKAYQDSDPTVRQASIRAIEFQSDLMPYASTLQTCAKDGDQVCSQLLGKLGKI